MAPAWEHLVSILNIPPPQKKMYPTPTHGFCSLPEDVVLDKE